MSLHAEIAPSAMNRIMNCAASVQASSDIKNDDDEWNIEGTLAHDKLELWLNLGVPPTDGILYEHLEHAYEYALKLEADGYTVYFEKQVKYNDRLWGTTDIIGIKKRKAKIADYKHGYRPVEIKGNAQVPTYAICAEKTFDVQFSEVELTIIQPRIPHRDGVVRSMTVDDEFLQWHTQEVLAAIKRADSENPEFYAGKHCKFCPLEGNCKTYANWIANIATGEDFFI